MPGLLQLRPEVVRKKENTPSDVRRRGETGLTVKSIMSTLVKRIMRAPSRGRMRKIETSLAERMEGLEGIEHTERSPHEGNLGMKEGRVKSLTEKGVEKKSLTDLSGTEKNPITRSPGGATRKQK
jgi:hypothetical protein